MEQYQPLVIYHKSCIDGQGAAAVCVKHFRYAELFGGVYSQPIPDVVGRDVYLVDFSYPKEKMQEMLEAANSVTIIDHHLTAINDLQDFEHPKLTKFMSNDNSGAVLAWKFFYPNEPLPDVLMYIEDRDLWIKKYKDITESIASYLYAIDFNVDAWVRMLDRDYWDANEATIRISGMTLLLQERKRVASLARHPRWIQIGGHNVPAVNCNAYYASDVGHALCACPSFAAEQSFSATYYDIEDARVFSLRSAEDGADVSAIAKQYGGGGHFHAAGFKVTREQVVEFGWA